MAGSHLGLEETTEKEDRSVLGAHVRLWQKERDIIRERPGGLQQEERVATHFVCFSFPSSPPHSGEACYNWQEELGALK